ncbi:MAG: DUF503 domain-containing protein [Pseudomonadales bacterium]
MSIGAMRIEFYLAGCRSLKEKRQRLNGVRERFGRLHHVAVSETHYQDLLQRAEWTFVATAAARDVVERTLTDIERNLQESVDAQIIAVDREWLD